MTLDSKFKEKFKSNLTENVNLSNYSWFKLGGDAEYFYKAKNIDHLKGLEVELIYEWEVGSMLIFDRSHLHCSSCVIEGKKIGIATFTKK